MRTKRKNLNTSKDDMFDRIWKMGERNYWISGKQVKEIQRLAKLEDDKGIKDLLTEIKETQYVLNEVLLKRKIEKVKK